MSVLMRGAYLCRTLIMGYMREAVPRMSEFARDQWGTDHNFDDVEFYEAYEALKMSHGQGPTLSMSVSRTSGFRRVDYDPVMAEQYRAEYMIRMFVYCYTPDSEIPEELDEDQVVENARQQTMRQRDDLSAIVRACILDRLSLGHPDVFDVNEGSLVEEYSDGTPVPNASGRWLAACAFTFTVRVDESLYREQLGQVPATGVQVIGELLPKEL